MELPQTLTRSVAAQLGTKGLFMGGDRALFRLYANVPVSCVETNRPPPENAEKDGGSMNVIDLLVCKSCNDEAVLGVIFGENSWIDCAIFMEELKGLDHLFFHPAPERTPESIEVIASGIYNYLQAKLSDADIWSDGPPEFALRALPAEDVVGKPDIENRLVRSRLLLKDGTITAYGQDCGLIEQYGADGAGWQRGKLAIVKSRAKNVKAPPRGKQPERKVSLAERLGRLNQQLPGDDVYGAYVTSALRRLLATPLEELCADDPDALACLTYQLECACLLLESDTVEVFDRAYTDALKMVYGLCREYVGGGSVRDELREHAAAILTGLAHRLLALPTRTGPHEISEYPILSLPVPHYFYAASALDGSDYPNWFYNQQFLMDRDRSKNCLNYTALQLRRLLERFLNTEDEDPFPMLYDLLVEPIFPGVRLTQSMI